MWEWYVLRMSIPVTRTAVRLSIDPKRVISKPFVPGGYVDVEGRSRSDSVLARVFALGESDVKAALAATEARFEHRHRDLRTTLADNAGRIIDGLANAPRMSSERRLLIGAYFTHEYSIESAALTNPSIVPAPSQHGLRRGEVRFVLSLRAIGEGHISSIEFRSGVVNSRGHVTLDPPGAYVETGRRRPPIYVKNVFRAKLLELHAHDEVAARVLQSLPERFTLAQLESVIRGVEQEHRPQADGENVAYATRTMHWLASSNYESTFHSSSKISERVLFPAGPTESSGMEDARFVRFTDDDGSVQYFATYSAYDGHQVLPQLIETEDFLTFRIATLNGDCARNKGIALFPRKVGGLYAALGRLDNENNFFMSSDNVRFWYDSRIIQRPEQPWELTHVGNCGSPMETEAGWLVITHGVGPLRQYALGAILLDRDEPTRVLGRLREPLLEPSRDERDGYVPNVLYSCGSMLAGEHVVLPYGVSDTGTRIATVRIDDLLTELTRPS